MIRHDPAPDDALDELMAAIRAVGPDEDAQLRAWLAAVATHVRVPVAGMVVGVPVEVLAIEYDGHPRRGFTARCRRAGHEYRVSLADVIVPGGVPGASSVTAYRRWLGRAPDPPVRTPADRPGRRPKGTDTDLPLDRPVELAVWAVKEGGARCRVVGTAREVTVRSAGLWRVVPGEIITVQPTRRWRYAGHPYLAGAIETARLDVPTLGLTPLRLRAEGTWDPEEEYWGEPDEPREDWVVALVARGPRPQFEMEQVLPGAAPDDPDDDPILAAVDRQAAGDPRGARQMLMDLLAQDLRCLDAHAHLGNFGLDADPAEARRHYEVGVRIGDLSLGPGFAGVLAWGLVDNRPFLRCLHGLGLSLWRLGRLEEAGVVFERLLWLNPGDHQGARFCRAQVRAGRPWERDDDPGRPH